MLFSFLVLFFIYCNTINAQELINAVSARNGGIILRAPASRGKSFPTKVGAWSPEALVDGLNHVGWCSNPNTPFPHIFIFELSETYLLSGFRFNNQCEKYEGDYTSHVAIELSESSPDSGYISVFETQLLENAGTTWHFIEETSARWVKLIIKSNYGNSEITELMEFSVLGFYKNPELPLVNISGVWKTTWGNVNIWQTGTRIHGCYEYNFGALEGGTDRRNIIFRYEEDWKEDEIRGWGLATLVVNAENNRMHGIFGYENNLKDYGFWNFVREKPEPDACPGITFPEQVRSDILGTDYGMLEEQMKKSGRIILYGINFELGKSEVKPGSEDLFISISALLKNNPDMRISIEGHTDDIGEEETNLILSEKRAASVKQILCEKFGILDERISVLGMGENAPLADNDTEGGRAANRRVEIVANR